MDLSKLPRLSGEKRLEAAPDVIASPQVPLAGTSAAPAAPPSANVLPHGVSRPPGVGLEVWLSFMIGIVFLGLGWSFGQYLIATLTHQPFHTHVTWTDGLAHDGNEVAYWDLQGNKALSDLSIFLFGAALVVEAISLLMSVTLPGGRRSWLWVALGFMLVAVALNVFLVIRLLSAGIPLISLVAVALGGYSIYSIWTLLRTTPLPRAGSV